METGNYNLQSQFVTRMPLGQVSSRHCVGGRPVGHLWGGLVGPCGADPLDPLCAEIHDEKITAVYHKMI